MITPKTKKPSRCHDWSDPNRHNPERIKHYCRRCSPVCEPTRYAGAWSLLYIRTQHGTTAEKWPADMPVNHSTRVVEVVERFELKAGEAELSIDELITLYPRTRRDEPPAEPVRVPPSPQPTPDGAGATAEAAR